MKRQADSITENTSTKYLFALSAIVVLLLFFLFSGLVFGKNDPAKVQQTPLKESLTISGYGELIVEDWIYNPDRNFMIVTLNLEKSPTIYEGNLIFIAQEKEHPNRDLPTSVEYQDGNRYVVSIQQVSPSFEVMALDINKDEISNGSLIQGEPSPPKGGEKSNELARIYTDERKVKVDTQLSVQTEKEYEVAAISQKINQAKKTIEEKQEMIQTIEERLKEIDQKVVELESEQFYETEEEKEQTNAQINQLENKKEQLNREASDGELAIQTTREKLTMLKEKRDMVED
ncbi:hypothetical protein IQ283_05305 [Alkalihalobacillus hwajinpoensis]|uniref:hypothetical protein n=1 Tax=Guptibacillus hwajinpoensis TaxID=208199 RepID=UPI00188314FD|nr:hypothetical protein [Pseudalkalibacillus hwajinpoensis]MBF0706018.1 hypothetical protein [Pseudalkalibacillus hwajinpoensis]